MERLRRAGLNPNVIVLEITERDLINNMETALEVLREFRGFGFDIWVDDFGVGQSSLSRLKHLPVTGIKLDRSFIQRLDSEADDRVIVHSIIELAHRLKLTVVAEGVETEESLDILRRAGCDHAQGYHISKPLTAGDFESWLREN